MSKLNPHILLVEDEESMGKVLQFNLEAEHYAVTWVKDGKAALEAFFTRDYDLIILDIMLPYLDGFNVAKRIREKDTRIPILMLTARGQIKDKLHGLELGADDYMTKPFHLQELLLRVKRMLERKSWYDSSTTKQKEMHIAGKIIDFSSLEVREGEKKHPITWYEAMVLYYLINNKNKVISRQELLQKVWNLDKDTETRTVDAFISRLRKIIESDPKNPKYILSVRGVGYKFVDPEEQEAASKKIKK